jgi:hypothetical protein
MSRVIQRHWADTRMGSRAKRQDIPSLRGKKRANRTGFAPQTRYMCLSQG